MEDKSDEEAKDGNFYANMTISRAPSVVIGITNCITIGLVVGVSGAASDPPSSPPPSLPNSLTPSLTPSLPPTPCSFTFENQTIGLCPHGWSCTGSTTSVPYPSAYGVVTGNSRPDGHSSWNYIGAQGSKFFMIAGDGAEGTATSESFILPPEATHMEFLATGGANPPSGLYLKLLNGSQVAFGAYAVDTNTFGHVSVPLPVVESPVYLYASKPGVGNYYWDKLFLDNIYFTDTNGDRVHC